MVLFIYGMLSIIIVVLTITIMQAAFSYSTFVKLIVGLKRNLKGCDARQQLINLALLLQDIKFQTDK